MGPRMSPFFSALLPPIQGRGFSCPQVVSLGHFLIQLALPKELNDAQHTPDHTKNGDQNSEHGPLRRLSYLPTRLGYDNPLWPRSGAVPKCTDDPSREKDKRDKDEQIRT